MKYITEELLQRITQSTTSEGYSFAEIQKAEAEIAKIDKQLGNEKFVANAPAEIVDEQRSRRAELDSKRGKLTGARDQLG